MSRVLPGIGLTAFWPYGFDGYNNDLDADLRKLSALVMPAVLSRVAALPGAPTDGQIYLLTATADANKIAVRDNGAWVLYAPNEGWQVYVCDEDAPYIYDGAAWTGAINLKGPLTVTAQPAMTVNRDGGGSVSLNFRGYDNSALGGALVSYAAARGSLAAPLDSQSGDRMGIFTFEGYGGGGFRGTGGMQANVGTGTISATSMPCYLSFLTTPDGSVARAERLRIDQDGNLGVGANIWLDANRIFRLRVYTVATLPTAGTRGRIACVSDATTPTFLGALTGGGAVSVPVFDNGSAWVAY